MIVSNETFPEIKEIEKQDEDKIHLTEKEVEKEKIANKVLYKNSSFFKDFHKINEDSILTENKDESKDNYYFNMHLITELLKRYLAFLPLWSGIMNKPGDFLSIEPI